MVATFAGMSDHLPMRYAGPVEPVVNKTSGQRHAERVIKIRQALELRAHGHEYYQIAQLLDCAESTAREYIRVGLAETCREPADEVRKIELKRIDMLTQVYMKKAMEGHGPSCDRVIALMERRDRIEGIDAPMELDWAAVRAQFFGALQEAAGPELTTKVLQMMSERR